MRHVLRGIIRVYQATFSGLFRNSCRHEPTCSNYAYEAIGRHGSVRGSWLSLKRLGRCRPGGSSGYDPVPERDEV
jgi:uncharacterized protein